MNKLKRGTFYGSCGDCGEDFRARSRQEFCHPCRAKQGWAAWVARKKSGVNR